jgi:hypothetical protein
MLEFVIFESVLAATGAFFEMLFHEGMEFVVGFESSSDSSNCSIEKQSK